MGNVRETTKSMAHDVSDAARGGVGAVGSAWRGFKSWVSASAVVSAVATTGLLVANRVSRNGSALGSAMNFLSTNLQRRQVLGSFAPNGLGFGGVTQARSGRINDRQLLAATVGVVVIAAGTVGAAVETIRSIRHSAQERQARQMQEQMQAMAAADPQRQGNQHYSAGQSYGVGRADLVSSIA